MKKNYLIIAFLFSTIMFGQNSTFNNASGAGDGKWSTATNWSAGLPTGTATISANVDLDVNVSLSGGVTSGASIVTTSNNSKVTIPTTTATISTGLLCNGANFNFNAPIEFNSSGNTTFLKSLQVNNVSGGTQRILTLGASSVLTLNSLMRVVTQFDSKVVFRGKIEGNSNLQITGISEFATTADNTGYNGDFVYINANSGTVVSNTTVDGGFLKAGRKVQINNTGNNLTINGANSCDGNVVVGGTHAFTLNINANQESFGTISVAEGSLAINVGASVTNLSFADCSSVVWGTAGTVAFTGFQPGEIRFGTSNTALTAEQLAKISADGTATGQTLALDSNGYLVLASSLVPPTISSLTSNGTSVISEACGGSILIINGANFSGTTVVTVNGLAFSSFVVTNSTTISAVLPANATTGLVTVSNTIGSGSSSGSFTVNQLTTNGSETVTTCGSAYTWPLNNQTYTSSGTYTHVVGCNTATLTLTLSPNTTNGSITTSICGGTTYVWSVDNVTYSNGTTQTVTNDCNTATLNLTIVNPTTTGSEAVSQCGTSYTWPLNNQTYTTSGNYNYVVGCNTATLALTLTPNTTTGSETVSACGSSYVWALNGQTYNASGNYTHVVGCNTATLSLTLTPNTTTGSETISQCGGTYTWPVNSVTYSASTTEVVTVGCNTATLNLTITAPTTTGSETISQCGGTYTWPVNSVTYSASTTEVVTSGCNTATLNLTITAPTTNGNVTQVQTGGTYTWVANGTTYSTSGIYTHVVGCNTATLDLTINPAATEIPETFPAFCKGATVATATGTTSMKFYTALTGGLPLAGTTALATGKTLFVTEVVNSVESSPRVPRLITVNVIPATPASMTTTDAVLCKYVGTTNTVTYTVAPVATATSYLWSVPAGANVIADASETDNVITVNFLGSPLNNISVGGLGTISARAVNSFDCPSAPRSLVLTAKLPTAPTSLTMTSADTTDHFNLPVVPATLPATFTFSSLADLLKITKVGPYMGTSTVFTLTAPAAPTAASYAWTLPSGATQLSGGTSNIITVDFAGVPAGIGSLPIVVKSAGGCGLSTARTLTLGRTVPGAPTALTLTNSSQPNLSSLPKITKVGPYTGTSIQFTLTATPFLTQGATSTSYAWILPTGVNCTSTNTPTTVNQLVNVGTPELPIMEMQSFAAISTPTNVITVNFLGATGTGNLELKVFGVNGAGNSIARKLVLARALPTAPTALVLRDGATVVTKVGPYVGESTSLTLTATPFLTQGAEATSFTWTLPAGVNVTAGATLVSNNATTTTWTSTGTVLTIDFDGVAPAVFSLPLSVQAVNGAGTSATTRTLTVTSAAPTTPGSITTPTLAIPTYNPACPGTTTITVQVPSVFGVTYTWTVGGTEAIITGGQGTNSITIDVEAVTATTLAISVVGSNGTGISPTRALTIKKVGTCRIAPESATASKFSAKAYPNPSSSEFTIETSAKGAMSVKVYDMQGRLVEKADTNRVGSRLAAGAYNVIVNQGANTKTLRVIKK